MQEENKKRLLIFIVAYNAEKHIEKVLDRIPKKIIDKYDYEILIIDDSSSDKTFETAQNYLNTNSNLNIRNLYNPINQGYGGNQKLGYEYAIQNNFDVVVLLHGDGQYAPEVMDDLVKPIFQKEAEAVFGSRMLKKGDAVKGGMPLYKYYGNKILTGFQNKMLKSSLSEFHSGYRAYSVDALNKVPFKSNSNDFHFDTQIIIQFIISKMKIHEIAIPTYYGEEICHVDGMKYGWNVIKETIASKLHRLSIFYKREYDITNPMDDYSLKLGYMSSHTLAIKEVADECKVLDIGGGQGRVASELKKKSCFVTGVDRCKLAESQNYDNYIQQDLDYIKFDFNLGEYNSILLLDIIEHLINPEDFMDKLRAGVGMSQPKIIVTTPNIAFFIVRLQLLFGKFNYGKEGILDKTHKRLFTFKTLKKMFIQCGYTIEKTIGIPAPFPKALGINFWGKSLLAINRFLIFLSKSLFSYQIYMEIKPTPLVEALLEHSVSESKKRKESINL